MKLLISKVVGLIILFLAGALSLQASASEVLRVLSWEGYVTENDLDVVNAQLKAKGYDYKAEVISPLAEGAEQMFDLIRRDKVDISFLTLFFIKMEREQTSRLLQPINIRSPRLSNYKDLLPSLTRLPMGMDEQDKPLYIPWGGGAYGFYVDRNKVKKADVPTSIHDLWQPKWRNKYALNKSQEWYNIGLALMNVGKSPFYVHELAVQGNRKELIRMNGATSSLQYAMDSLYAHAGDFWTASPKFKDKLLIVSSWGPEIARENKKGGNWELIRFKEGLMVWLDTINFVKGLSGKKLEAAEIFANYFIDKKVQNRITHSLSMVAASSEAEPSQLLGSPETIFKEQMFVPPYDSISYSIMRSIADKASKKIQVYHAEKSILK